MEETVVAQYSASCPVVSLESVCFLPTKVNLVKRKVCEDDRCGVCGLPESEIHYTELRQCRLFLIFWSAHTNPEDIEQWALFCSGIWQDRNRRMFKGEASNPEERVVACLASLRESQSSRL
ncbi:LOW QUALITY PROTEIN: hypothetical protein V2J09_021580 [Rumex salicifolius]